MKRLTLSRPHFKWKLDPSPGSYATDPRWSNKDLDPVPVKDRTWTTLDYANYWISDMLAPPLWSTIAAVMSLGLTARQVIPITFFGFLICGYVVGLNGRTAAIYRVPYSVIVRSSFGMWGAIPAIIVRSFVALLWTAITIVQGGGYVENVIGAIWPSYLNIPNTFSPSLGITTAEFGCVMIYWGVQTAVALLPIQRLRLFFLFKSLIVPPCFLALFIWAVVVTHGGGPLVTGEAMPVRNMAYSVFTALNIVIGLFSSLAVNMPDFGRYSKNERSGRWQWLLLPIIGTSGALAPIFVTSANKQLFGSYTWYFPAVIANFSSRAARCFVGFSFAIATMGNNIAAGSYPFSIDVSALAPRYLNRVRGTLLMAAFCLASNPWLIIQNAGDLLAFLSGYSCIMSEIAGIMVVHFYLVHKRLLNVGELYNPHGIYRYNRGWNWRAYVAFFCGFGPVFPGFLHAVSTGIDVPDGSIDLYAGAWLFGIIVAGVVYYLLSTRLPARESFVDVPIYPPQTEEEEHARAMASKWGAVVEIPETPMSESKEFPLIVNELKYDVHDAAETGSLPPTPKLEKQNPFSTKVIGVE